MRVGAACAEALAGCVVGGIEWDTLAYITRFTVAPTIKGFARIEKFNDRFDLCEQGRFDDLSIKIVGQQLQDEVKKESVDGASEERLAA